MTTIDAVIHRRAITTIISNTTTIDKEIQIQQAHLVGRQHTGNHCVLLVFVRVIVLLLI